MLQAARQMLPPCFRGRPQCLPDLIAPDDIANLALFLASDDSRQITKQTISVNSGVL